MKKRSKASERRYYNIFDSFCRKDPRLGTTNAWKSNSIPDHTSLQRLRPKVSRFHCPRAFHTSEYIYASWFKKKKKDPFSLLLPRPLPPSCSSWLMNKGSANRIKGEPNPPLIIFWRVSERINDRVCLWASFWKISRSISKNGNFYVNEKLNISSFVWYLSYWLLLERMMEQVEAI